ncbi:MAG TPA: glycerol-3-phosphate dehydrogenase, partial [Leptospiraceae bacterium]|nr:glycerol-3-phosphate dehydrogenase [Leptospiraceae bacterium]
NTRAALITRGLAEITKLGVRKGADPLTFLGLAGLGDLVLTCTGDLSRNRTVGFKLGQGMKLQQILTEMNQVAEGVVTTESAHLLAQKLGIEMAITDQVYQLLYQDKDPKQVVRDLMTRDLKRE